MSSIRGLEDWEVGDMRDDAMELLPDLCNILNVTKVADGYGGVVSTWGTAIPSVRCRFDMQRGDEVVAAGAAQAYNPYTITLPYDTSLVATNRVEYIDENGGTALYNIVHIDERKSWPIFLRVQLERLVNE